ncbi:MAG: acetate--CoA ligase family protein [Acidobacteria bacterium]|uniref:Acetate--CoA ligase family protein n=1 Tax=Candidatus Polarisedimenticola svalbardensis TaxID=2886004 RepID=A0A8J7CEB9_9BACT|nr:acetate--CoA ligase family protein [Candidatus Polarisedimenticola svalbardensis]
MASRQLGFNESRALLETVGIPVLGRRVSGLDAVLNEAAELGYPVVIKAVTPRIIHKTDVGVVFLNIKDEDQLRSSYDALIENARMAGVEDLDGILVQKMAEPGFELLIGAKQDPCFGPVTMIGHGGRFVELFRDVAPGVGALERGDVERMLSRTMAGRILDGFRGPALDRDAAIDLTIRVSRFMDDHPAIHELDLNPVLVYESGFAIVDARLIEGEPVSHPRYTDLSPARMKSLESVFNPKSVAVLGASKPGTVGGIIFKNSSRIAKIYPVNPRYETVYGKKCYAGLEDLPEPAEVGVFVTGAEKTPALFEQFCEQGGRGAVIVSDGFAEIGRSDLEDELVATSRKHDTVYIGPNGLGVIDNFSGLNTMFIPEQRTAAVRKPSGLGVITQSGGIGLELLEMLAWDHLSVGRWISCGNASGVEIPEILASMGADPRINIIAVYVEGLRNGLQFLEVGRRVSRDKPVIVIKGGVSGGAAATMSHTASLAGSFEAFKACCEQAGFFLIEELTEDPKILTNIVSILTTQPRAHGNRVAVVGVGGGAAILLADQVTEEGMVLADFAPETRSRLVSLLGRENGGDRLGSNPVDLFGDCDDNRLLEALRILDEDTETDVILAALYFQVPYLSEYFTERLTEMKPHFKKPVIISPRGFSAYVNRSREYLSERGFQTYTVPMIKPLATALEIWKRYPMDR